MGEQQTVFLSHIVTQTQLCFDHSVSKNSRVSTTTSTISSVLDYFSLLFPMLCCLLVASSSVFLANEHWKKGKNTHSFSQVLFLFSLSLNCVTKVSGA